MNQHHKALAALQTCECCGANVNLHGSFMSRWTGHANIFFHQHCYDAIVRGDALDSMGAQVSLSLTYRPARYMHEDNGN